MIEPGIGRIVHYVPAGHPADADPHAAMIVGIWDSRTINLAIFDCDGAHYQGTHVPLLQDDDKPPADRGYAKWPDHQKGQAAKTEQLAAQLAAPGAAAPAPQAAEPVTQTAPAVTPAAPPVTQAAPASQTSTAPAAPPAAAQPAATPPATPPAS